MEVSDPKNKEIYPAVAVELCGGEIFQEACWDVVSLAAMTKLELRAFHYQLEFREPFGIAHGVRNTTDTIYVQASFMDTFGYGEAALPPYLGYDPAALVRDFHSWFPAELSTGDAIRDTMAKLNLPGNLLPKPLKTAVDIAMYDLFGKLTGKPVRSIFGIQDAPPVLCSYTLGISSVEEQAAKVSAADDFKLFKLKLGGANDRERLEAFVASGHSLFCVDANQAWKSVEVALEWMKLLKEMGCLFVEQPLPVDLAGKYADLYKSAPLPVILDESVQSLQDILDLQSVCHGVNVKLVKAGGLEPAVAMVRQANKSGLKVLVGCMSESTCGAMAAAQLSPWADWVDLDGPRLIKNDPFSGAVYANGSLVVSPDSGTGALPENKSIFGRV